jgi:hypothetical protein
MTSSREEPVHQSKHATGRENSPGHIEATARRFGLALINQARDQRDRDGGDRRVDEEDPAPVEVRDDDSRENHADHGAEPCQAGPDAERARPFLRFGEQQRDERQRGRRGKRFARALREAARDEHPLTLRCAAHDGRDGEQPGPDQEQTSSAQEVADATTEQQKPTRHQCVPVDDPREAAGGEVKGFLDRGQRDIHHGDVDHDHELHERENCQRLPAPRVERGCELRLECCGLWVEWWHSSVSLRVGTCVRPHTQTAEPLGTHRSTRLSTGR